MPSWRLRGVRVDAGVATTSLTRGPALPACRGKKVGLIPRRGIEPATSRSARASLTTGPQHCLCWIWARRAFEVDLGLSELSEEVQFRAGVRACTAGERRRRPRSGGATLACGCSDVPGTCACEVCVLEACKAHGASSLLGHGGQGEVLRQSLPAIGNDGSIRRRERNQGLTGVLSE